MAIPRDENQKAEREQHLLTYVEKVYNGSDAEGKTSFVRYIKTYLVHTVSEDTYRKILKIIEK